jgi:hypothetical protein
MSMRDGDVTDHDRHVILKALALAIEFISTLPENSQLSSDVDDMRRLLRAMLPKDEDLATYQKSVQWMVHDTRLTNPWRFSFP